MQRTWKGRARWLRGIESKEFRVGAQRWSLTQFCGLASWRRAWLSRDLRICSETIELSDLGSDSQGSHPCSKSHRLCVTLGWLGNLSCFIFFIHTMEMIIAPTEDQTGLVV